MDNDKQKDKDKDKDKDGNASFAYCKNHRTKHAKQFCDHSTCKVFICNSCALANHSGHLSSLKNLSDLYASNTDYVNKILRKYHTAFNDKSNVLNCLNLPMHLGRFYCEKCKGFLCSKCSGDHDKGHYLIDKDKFVIQMKLSVDLFMSMINYPSHASDGVKCEDYTSIVKKIDERIMDLIKVKQKIMEIDKKRKQFIFTTITKMHKDIMKKRKPIFPSDELLSKIIVMYDKVRIEKDAGSLFNFYTEFKTTIDSFLGKLTENNQHLTTLTNNKQALELKINEYNLNLYEELKRKNKDYLSYIRYYLYQVQEILTQNDESFRKSINDVLKMKKDEFSKVYPEVIFDPLSNEKKKKYISEINDKNIPRTKSYMTTNLDDNSNGNGNDDHGYVTRQIKLLENHITFRGNDTQPQMIMYKAKGNISEQRNDGIDRKPITLDRLSKTPNKRTNNDSSINNDHDNKTNNFCDITNFIKTNENDTPTIIEEGPINIKEHIITYESMCQSTPLFSKKYLLLNEKYQENCPKEDIENIFSTWSQEELNMVNILQFKSNTSNIYVCNPYTKTIEEVPAFSSLSSSSIVPLVKFPSAHSVINVQPYAYLSGGRNEKNQDLNSLIRYNRLEPNLFAEILLSPMKEARSGHSSIYLKPFNCLCFISGSRTRSCEKYMLDTHTYQPMPDLIAMREKPAVCLVNDAFIYVFFGLDRLKGKYVTTIEKMELRKNEWKMMALPGNQNILKKYGCSCFRYDYDNRKGIIITGGINSMKNETKDVLYYTIDNNTACLFNSVLGTNASFVHCDYYTIGNDYKVNISEGHKVILFNENEGRFY